jgi:hypothetical protein
MRNSPCSTRCLEVLVRGGDNPHVTGLGSVAADALEAALLQHAQQLDLHLQGHVADFIEEQGTAGGHFEAALAAADRPGESALLVTEQFRLEQVARDGAAVDRDEGPVARGERR